MLVLICLEYPPMVPVPGHRPQVWSGTWLVAGHRSPRYTIIIINIRSQSGYKVATVFQLSFQLWRSWIPVIMNFITGPPKLIKIELKLCSTVVIESGKLETALFNCAVLLSKIQTLCPYLCYPSIYWILLQHLMLIWVHNRSPVWIQYPRTGGRCQVGDGGLTSTQPGPPPHHQCPEVTFNPTVSCSALILHIFLR